MDAPMASVGTKRPSSKIEDIAPEAKEGRIEAVHRTSILQGLPPEIQKKITTLINSSPPGFGIEKLYNIANSIRSLRQVSTADRDSLDDPELMGALINFLANRYANGNQVKVALVLHTKSAADWLHEELLKESQRDSTVLVKKLTNELIEQLNEKYTDAAQFLFNAAKITGEDKYLLLYDYKTEALRDTLLIAAARAGNLKIFNVIFANCGDIIDHANDLEQTALSQAIDNNHTQIALMLIHNGARPYVIDDENHIAYSALLHASNEANIGVVKELLKNPEVVQLINYLDKDSPFSAIEFAAIRNAYDIFKMLLAVPGVTLRGDVLFNALENNTQMVQDLMAAGINVNAQSLEGDPAAFGVFERSDKKYPKVNDVDTRDRLKILLPKLAIDQKNNAGATLLIMAVQQAKAKTVDLLLQANSDASLVDAQGHTALWYAQQLESHNKDYIIRLLTDAAAKQGVNL